MNPHSSVAHQQTSTGNYSALQIAIALKISKRNTLKALSGTKPNNSLVIHGNETPAWSFDILPENVRAAIVSRARENQQSIADYIETSCKPWKSKYRIGEIADLCLELAKRLRAALLPALQRMDAPTLTTADHARIGLEDYEKAFGHCITERHWRRLMDRTCRRAGSGENFERLELYLPENVRRKTSAQANAPALDDEFITLHSVIASFKNPTKPSTEEKNLLWISTFEILESNTGRQRKKTKRAVLKFLWQHAPTLALSENALRMQWERKYQRWIAANRAAAALTDRRPEVAARRRFNVAPEDREKITAHATFNTGGRVSQAWRELRDDDQLSADLLGRFQANPASKSHVPHSIRAAVGNDVALLEDIHHGPRQAKLNGAHISRDWSNVPAGDWYQSDDATLPLYYFVPDGRGWFTLMRGQFLPMIDLRSTCILDFVLLSERNYNALSIRSLITKVCDKYGLPRRGFAFENGIWRSARILKGASDTLPSQGEVEMGLRSLGLEFQHATLPRVKPIERVIGLLQDRMEGDAGYIGRNEMLEKFERVQRQKLEVERHQVHPAKYFYSEEQWLTRLAEICEHYNATPQDGKMTGGLSPEDAYAKYQNPNDPPVKFDATCRYLLATHRRPVRVTANGVTLRFGKRTFNYRNEETGKLVGQSVLAFFDPDCPETLTITDMNRQNPVCIPRALEVPAMDATPEQIGVAMASVAAHQSYARTYYSNLKAKFIPRHRLTLIDAETAEFGRVMNQQRAELETNVRIENQRHIRARKTYGRLGMPMPAASRMRPDAPAAAGRLSELLNEQDETELKT